MTLTVIENAYLRIAEQNPFFSETHKKIILVLLHEKKYYTTQELLCFANHSETKLEKALSELSKAGLVKVDGWLVRLAREDFLEKMFSEEYETRKAIAELALI